jgi:hypothetical protein
VLGVSHAAGAGAGAEPVCALQNGLKANAHLEQLASVHRLEVIVS